MAHKVRSAAGCTQSRLVIVCIMLHFCSIASDAVRLLLNTLGGSTPERCHPEDVLLSLPYGAAYGVRQPAGRAAHLDIFVLGVAQGSRHEARLVLRKEGFVVHEEWRQFHCAVERDDEAQNISFAVPPLPAGSYAYRLNIYDVCGLSASISAYDEDDRLVRLLAGLNWKRRVDVDDFVGNCFSERSDQGLVTGSGNSLLGDSAHQDSQDISAKLRHAEGALDFHASDLTGNLVVYPWRFNATMQSAEPYTTYLRLVLYENNTSTVRAIEACVLVDFPPAFAQASGQSVTANCDLFYLRDAGTLAFGNYTAEIFLYQGRYRQEELHQETGDRMLFKSPRRQVNFQPPPTPLPHTPPASIPTRRHDDDQVIRIDDLAGLLGNVLIQLGVVFTLAHKCGANVVRIPVTQPFRSADSVEQVRFNDAEARSANSLHDFFPGLPGHLRLPIPQHGRWKGEVSSLVALRVVLAEEKAINCFWEAPNACTPTELKGDTCSCLHAATKNNTQQELFTYLSPFGESMDAPFKPISWVHSIAQRSFAVTLLPWLQKTFSLPDKADVQGWEWGTTSDFWGRGETLVLHFRSGLVHSYRNTRHVVSKNVHQPPLAFYIVSIETHLLRFPHARLLLLTNKSPGLENVCIQPILDKYPQARLLNQGSASEDFALMVYAKHIVLS